MGRHSFPGFEEQFEDDELDFPDAYQSYSSNFQWSPGDEYVAFNKGPAVCFVDSGSGQEKQDWTIFDRDLPKFLIADSEREQPLLHPSISPDGRLLVCSIGRTAYVFEMQSRKLAFYFRAEIEPQDIFDKELNALIEVKRKYSHGRGLTGEDELEECEFNQAINKLIWATDSKQIFAQSEVGWMIFDVATQRCTNSNYLGRWHLCNSVISSDFVQVVSVTAALGQPATFIVQSSSQQDSEYQLVSNHFVGSSMVASPVGRKFIFSTVSNELVAFDIDAKALRILCPFRDNYSPHLAWSPDGKYLAVHSPALGVEIVDAVLGVKIADYKSQREAGFCQIERGHFAWANHKNELVLGRKGPAIDFWKVV